MQPDRKPNPANKSVEWNATSCRGLHSTSRTVCLQLWNPEDHRVPDKRVIDCETRTVLDAPEGCEFTALSYVWGTPNREEDVFSVSTEALLPDTLPLTVRDAMQVVLELGIRYLWVDKYCIDQYNPTELQSQISVMDFIYDRAVFTIIAACGDDASFGPPGVSSRHRIPQATLNLDGRIWVSAMQNPQAVVKKSRWFTRGWTY
ncbi:heterokaryon incompatibility protein-domain-containing protein [Podospora fimiseda]|uniref:Heterokaryon incompatibility protein-domain-containing protein n=1 Tax=Podospora fimiseda TaxID=252190 RepID=A0AAN6YJV4_9PEZI|nr:heterokaryon incompatibility protein-domain-containing protein [Podospora fimiseda]